MELSQEQVKNIKEQLISQIESTFPEEKKQETIQEIQNMDNEQLIEFLKKNNLIGENKQEGQKCVFCSMVFGDIPVTKIAEDKDAIAVLEINPISKGHTLIIPKQHILEKQEVQEKTQNLANEIENILKNKLKPKQVLSSFSELFQHGIINLVPVYKDENLNSPRKQATNKELQEIHKLLTSDKIPQIQKKETTQETPKPKKKKRKKTINKKNTWLPNRIP